MKVLRGLGVLLLFQSLQLGLQMLAIEDLLLELAFEVGDLLHAFQVVFERLVLLEALKLLLMLLELENQFLVPDRGLFELLLQKLGLLNQVLDENVLLLHLDDEGVII